MSDIVQNISYDDVLELLLEQYKDSTNLIGVLAADNTQAVDIESALFEILNLYWLDTATGTQLDVIGSIFNVERAGRTDSEYRQYIKFRKSLLFISGTPEEIILALKDGFNATFVTYVPLYPSGFFIYTDGSVTQDELNELSPSGVQGYVGSPIVSASGNCIQTASNGTLISFSTPGTTFALITGDGDAIITGDGDTLIGV